MEKAWQKQQAQVDSIMGGIQNVMTGIKDGQQATERFLAKSSQAQKKSEEFMDMRLSKLDVFQIKMMEELKFIMYEQLFD